MSTKSYPGYLFMPGRRSILAEIYFPKRIATQGKIYTTLEEGLQGEHVCSYLVLKAQELLKELAAYPHWFDPNRYKNLGEFPDSLAAAQMRMSMCEQVFYGWSMYEVDGVFWSSKRGRIDEERTQVIRLMFKFDDESHEAVALSAGYPDVYRAILYWVLSEYGHTGDDHSWGSEERTRFLNRHLEWEQKKRIFAEELYGLLAPRVAKWIADCGLFIFGYLVREFWMEIVRLHVGHERHLEDEIWVTSIFHLNVNVMTQVPSHGIVWSGKEKEDRQ